MSLFQNILGYINEDYAPPTVRLIVITQKEILLNKIVSKKSTLHDIFKQESIKEGKNYFLFGKPLNLEQKVIDLIPNNYSNLSNIELIIQEKYLSLDEDEIYYEKILKPYENPFKILVFAPNDFNISLKSYSNETIEKFSLNKFSEKLSSYCNTPNDLYISGGIGDDYSSANSGNKHFWKISSIKSSIDKLEDLPNSKQNHSMIYIPKRYIYFIGGNNKNTFYYDELFSTFSSWARMNNPVKSPLLILVNNLFIYSFGEPDYNTNNNFSFERTNLKSTIPSWELKTLKGQNLPLRNFGGILTGNEIYFLGGRSNRGDKVYKFNITSEKIEKGKQENTKLKPLDKNFYKLNEYNSAMIPDCKGDNIQVIIFNNKRKKYKKILYEKHLDEIVNNDTLKNGKINNKKFRDSNQMEIIWKEYKTNYMDNNSLPENMILLPSLTELKNKVNDYKNEKNNEIEIGKKEENSDNIDKLKNFIDNNNNMINNINNDELNIQKDKQDEQEDFNNNKSKDINYSENKLDEENNNINNSRNMPSKVETDILLNEKIKSSPKNMSLKEIFSKDINESIDLKTKYVEFPPLNSEKKSTNNINNSNSKNNETPTLYRKKTIIRQDKKDSIVIQLENSNIPINENSQVNNKNILNKAGNLNENNTFNIEYNNEIIVGEKNNMMLSDIISSNSELNMDKINKGLNNQIVVNVPKYKADGKIEAFDENNTFREVKYDNKKQDKNINNNINDLNNNKIEEIKISKDENYENNKKSDNEISEENNNKFSEIKISNNASSIKEKNKKENNTTMPTKEKKEQKLEVEIIEKGVPEKKEENKIKKKSSTTKKNIEINNNINIKDNKDKNLYSKSKNNKNKTTKESDVLLIDKITYNNKDKSKLNNTELSKSKNYDSKIISGTIKGTNKTKNNFDKNKKDTKNTLKNKEKKNISQHMYSSSMVDIDSNINKILNKDITIPKYEISNDNKPSKKGGLKKEKTEIKVDKINIKNLPLKNENIGKDENIELNIKMPGSTFEENQLNINLKPNKKININDSDINAKISQNNDNIPVNKSEIKKKPTKIVEINLFDDEEDKEKKDEKNNDINIEDKQNQTEEPKEIEISLKEHENNNDDNNIIQEPLKTSLKDDKEKNNIELNKENNEQPKIYENISGTIVGTPRINYIVEYGSTKGYERPNIKKSKDFVHEPQIIIEGTIKGNKRIPTTLKSIFEDNVDEPIILNDNLFKPYEYIINEADIPDNLKKKTDFSNISDIDSKMDNNKIEINNAKEVSLEEHICENKELMSNNEPNKIIELVKKDNDNDNENKMQLNKSDINKFEKSSENIIEKNQPESIEIQAPNIEIDINEAPLKGTNMNKKFDTDINIEGTIKGTIPEKNNNINININELNLNENQSISNKDININNPDLAENVNINKENEKEELKDGAILDIKNSINIDYNMPEANGKLLEDIIKSDNQIKEDQSLNKENDNVVIYENITGIIEPVSTIKNIVEYGSTKGYERPKIKKGKDFVHKPEFIIEGTIQGNQKIPQNLKSIFSDSIDNKIELNKINIKYPEIKLEDYSQKLPQKEVENSPPSVEINKISNKNPINITEKNINISESNINNKLPELKDYIEFSNNDNSEAIEINNNTDLNIDNNKLKGLPNPKINENININNPNIKTENTEEYIPDINKNNDIKINKEIPDLNINKSIQNKANNEPILYENITGIIEASPDIKNVVEYGSTKGYKRPKIKKGKDFIHKSELIIEGTIKGNKKSPLTLKSILEDNINNNIQLNKIKYPEIKLDDYPQILNQNIELNANKEAGNFELNEISINNSKINPELNKNIKADLEEKDKNINISESNINNKLPELKDYIEFSNNDNSEAIKEINKNIDLNIDNNRLKGLHNPKINENININAPNIKTENIEEFIPDINKDIDIQIKREIPDSNNNKTNSKQINNEPTIYKSITGIIEGFPDIKYIVEYGSTKGYKRPKIKKGKDFVHKPEFRIEGTIQGTKKIPITLKSLFEDSNNKTIQLNHISSKNGNLYKIKEEDIQLYSLNLKKPKIDINSSDLKLGNISIKEPNSKEKEEIIQNKIKGIDIKLKKGDDSKLNNPLKGPTKIRINSKNNKNSEKDNSERIKGMNEQINIGLSMPNFDIKSESLKGSNIKGSSNSNMQYNKTEVLTGTIYGSKNNNISKSNIIINKSEEGKNKQSKNESGLDKDSSHIKYIIEYGITKGYKRPKIKKGKDFVHKPEFRIEGTIQGNKIIPITLKSIFEGKVKDSIKLNNDSLKNPIFKIKDENIKNITTINLDNHLKENNNVNIKLKSSNGLHSSNKNIVNDNIKYIIEYGSTKGYKRPNIKKGKDFVHEPEFRMEGTIQGSKIMDENIKNSYKNNNDKAQLTSSKTLYFIEYGATLNYKRPNIKKGKDFYHEPKVKFIKNDSD